MDSKVQKLKAVALRYPQDAQAPFIVASAKGLKAEKIIQLAEEYKIPIVKDENAVEILSIQDVGQLIPEAAYQVVAEIFAFVKRMEKDYGK